MFSRIVRDPEHKDARKLDEEFGAQGEEAEDEEAAAAASVSRETPIQRESSDADEVLSEYDAELNYSGYAEEVDDEAEETMNGSRR